MLGLLQPVESTTSASNCKIWTTVSIFAVGPKNGRIFLKHLNPEISFKGRTKVSGVLLWAQICSVVAYWSPEETYRGVLEIDLEEGGKQGSILGVQLKYTSALFANEAVLIIYWLSRSLAGKLMSLLNQSTSPQNVATLIQNQWQCRSSAIKGQMTRQC